eukprot:UN10095
MEELYSYNIATNFTQKDNYKAKLINLKT